MKDETVNGAEPIQSAPPKPRAPEPASTDLSRRIEQTVERQPQDAVRCVRVFGDFYRCNWWSRRDDKRKGLDFDWSGLITDHVRKSRFLRVVAQGEQLTLEEVPRIPAARDMSS
ncbi:MAG: hypothetical protein ABSG31_13100 [Tepidisphaeraceae bacterium]